MAGSLNLALLKDYFIHYLRTNTPDLITHYNTEYDGEHSETGETPLGLIDFKKYFRVMPYDLSYFQQGTTPCLIVDVADREQPRDSQARHLLYDLRISFNIVLVDNVKMNQQDKHNDTLEALTVEESMRVRLEGYCAVIIDTFDRASRGLERVTKPDGTNIDAVIRYVNQEVIDPTSLSDVFGDPEDDRYITGASINYVGKHEA